MKGILEDRNKLVVKSNDLIRQTRYSLTEQEQKLLIYLISKINNDDTEFFKVTIRIKEFCSICGVGYNGRAIEHVRQAVKNLSDKSWWFKVGDHEILFRWIENAQIKKGTVTLKLSDFLTPHLLQLKENFTKYELVNVLGLKGKYSIRFYEIFKSYLWKRNYVVVIQELKNILQCEGYKTYKDFKVRVLEPSIKEINQYSDLFIEYTPIKDGRHFVALNFDIQEKSGVQMCLDMIINRAERFSNER